MNAAVSNPVGRPRTFDENEVLEKVMNVFWRHGYDGTSMADLLAATGLHKGSLYQAFGDKHSLFIRALSAYIESMGRHMQSIAQEAPSGLEALRRTTHYHIEHGVTDDGANIGCLALNTLVETAQDDPEAMKVLAGAFGMRVRLLSAAVRRAQAEGDVRSDWPVERIVHLIAAFEAGVLVELKGMLDEAGAKVLIDDFHESLRGPGH